MIRRFVTSIVLAAAANVSAADPVIQYNRDIRPILAEACFKCHGPDSASRQADLRLDQRDAAMGMTAIVPGKPETSEILRRLTTDDADQRMPPTGPRVSAEQVEKVQAWIAGGAPWPALAPQVTAR